jgi:hypothetical protein
MHIYLEGAMLKNLASNSVLAEDLDEAIRINYPKFAVPVDQIVSDPSISEAFARILKTFLGLKQNPDIATMNWRLMSLRKRGENNGGLPRLQRQYSGRINKPR